MRDRPPPVSLRSTPSEAECGGGRDWRWASGPKSPSVRSLSREQSSASCSMMAAAWASIRSGPFRRRNTGGAHGVLGRFGREAFVPHESGRPKRSSSARPKARQRCAPRSGTALRIQRQADDDSPARAEPSAARRSHPDPPHDPALDDGVGSGEAPLGVAKGEARPASCRNRRRTGRRRREASRNRAGVSGPDMRPPSVRHRRADWPRTGRSRRRGNCSPAARSRPC